MGIKIYQMKTKKGVMNQLIGVFVLVLIVAILAGMTFLFIANLKSNVVSSTTESNSVINETGWINQTGYSLKGNGDGDILQSNYVITSALNRTSGLPIVVTGNITVGSTGIVTNASAIIWNNASISYTYQDVKPSAYNAVNNTESASAGIIAYLPLVFLALIFGAILIIVLRVILPYISLSKGIGGTEI